MRRLVRVKGKDLGFDFSLGGGFVFGFAGFAGSFITALLSALEMRPLWSAVHAGVRY